MTRLDARRYKVPLMAKSEPSTVKSLPRFAVASLGVPTPRLKTRKDVQLVAMSTPTDERVKKVNRPQPLADTNNPPSPRLHTDPPIMYARSGKPSPTPVFIAPRHTLPYHTASRPSNPSATSTGKSPIVPRRRRLQLNGRKVDGHHEDPRRSVKNALLPPISLPSPRKHPQPTFRQAQLMSLPLPLP